MIANIDQWGWAFVDDGVRLCALPVSDNCDQLTSSELELVSSAVTVRQQTYSTGRRCAKTALSELGIDAQSYPDGLLRLDDGAVAWPTGAAGSISHTSDWALAAVVEHNAKFQSIGIDVEQIERVEKNVLRLIATDNERAYLESEPDLRWGRVALFSIKESLYKCLRPIYGEFIRFKDVEITELTKALDDEASVDASTALPELFSPSVQLIHRQLAEICDEQRIDVRLAVLDSHVVSFVGYRKL